MWKEEAIGLLTIVFLSCLESSLLLDSRRCSKIDLNKPYRNSLTLDKNGRVYIPFYLSSSGVFTFILGEDLIPLEDEGPYIFIKIEGHNHYSGGTKNLDGEEEIHEAFTMSTIQSFRPEEESKGYFIRIHVRTKSTSIALYPSGNEEGDPLLLFRVDTSDLNLRINSFYMKASPEDSSFIFVDCKSKLNQRCTFSTDCTSSGVPGSICRMGSDGESPRCVCSDSHNQKEESTCESIVIKLGDQCDDSRKCRSINAKCRREPVNDTGNKTCQCFKGQTVTEDGHCKDAVGRIDWARISRGYPLYQDLYPGKLPPAENANEERSFKEGPCSSHLALGADPERRIPIPYHKKGFDIKFLLDQNIDGTLKFSFFGLSEEKMGSLSLSNRGPDVLNFGKGFNIIPNYSGGVENYIFFRVDNVEGKSMLGFTDGVSHVNVSTDKISSVMDLPIDLGITSDFQGTIHLFCD